MSYKDLLVVLDSEPASRGRIDLAAALAERFAAHLIGLYPLPIPEAPRHFGYYDPTLLDPFFRELHEKSREACDKEREAFEHAASLRGLSAEWRMVDAGGESDPALHARYADLTILGQLEAEKKMWYHPAAFLLTKRDVIGAWLVCLAVATAFFGYPVVMTAFDDCIAGVQAGIAGHDHAS